MLTLRKIVLFSLLINSVAFGATIGIIDTGFDLDHEFLSPRILKQETDEEVNSIETGKDFHGWNFQDNSHLKEKVIKDQTVLDICTGNEMLSCLYYNSIVC